MAKKGQDMDLSEEALEEGAGPRVYELGFHLDPELASDEVKKAYKDIRAEIAKKGSIVAEAEPEKIPLAYTISRQETSGRRDFNAAYFSWIVYEAPPESHAAIVSMAGADTRVIRFIDLTTTKEIARHAVEVRELSLRASDRSKSAEHKDEVEVIGEEIDAALEHSVV